MQSPRRGRRARAVAAALVAGAFAHANGCNAESEEIGYDEVIRKLGGHGQ